MRHMSPLMPKAMMIALIGAVFAPSPSWVAAEAETPPVSAGGFLTVPFADTQRPLLILAQDDDGGNQNGIAGGNNSPPPPLPDNSLPTGNNGDPDMQGSQPGDAYGPYTPAHRPGDCHSAACASGGGGTRG